MLGNEDQNLDLQMQEHHQPWKGKQVKNSLHLIQSISNIGKRPTDEPTNRYSITFHPQLKVKKCPSTKETPIANHQRHDPFLFTSQFSIYKLAHKQMHNMSWGKPWVSSALPRPLRISKTDSQRLITTLRGRKQIINRYLW